VIFRPGFLLRPRPGELRALKWHHIDFKRGELTVLEYARVTGDGDTKTVDSRRTLQFDEETGAALLAHKAMQEAEAEKAGSSWLNTRGYVFCREDGQQLDRYGLRWRVKKTFKAAGLTVTDPYAMRHTFASLMDYAGETHQTIADMMGHRNVTTFEVVYRHNLRPVVKGTRSALAGIVG
jgi:integrase